MQKSAPLRWRSSTWGVWVLLGVILATAFLIRWRLRDCPLERDEGEYAYIGHLLREGVAPYGVAGNHKFPGAYLAYAAIMALFGETTPAIHIGLLIVNLVTAALLFFLGRRLAGNIAGLAATAAWVVTSVSPSVFGNAAHLTHFVMLAVVAGLLLLWRGLETKKSWPLIIGGMCLGASVIVRQTSLIFVAFGTVFFWLAARRTRKGTGGRATLVAASSLIPLAVTVVWLWIAGVLPDFWRWTVIEAAAYGSQVSFQEGLHQFFAATPKAISWDFLIWIGAAVGLAVTISKRARRDWFVIGFLLAGFFALLPGFYFREHYYLQLLPAVALLFGLAIASAWNMSAPWRYSAIAGALVALFLPFIGQRNYFLASTPTALSREIYGGNPFPEAIEVARYIEANSNPDERVAVLGSEPQIFFYSHRRSATTLIYTYPLMEHHQYAHAMQETMAREIEERRPQFIVFMNVPTSWLIRPDSDHFIFDWADSYLARNYQLDGIADILASGSQYVWGAAALNYRVRSPYFVSVYRRVSY
ncbi:MAG: hypothetical protein QOF80_2374 [Verrucomicrobiota bacterium]|jgi:hypothetical protein